MKLLNKKILVIVHLIFFSTLLGNGKSQQLALLSSTLISLASYYAPLKPHIKPVTPPPGPQPSKAKEWIQRKDFFKDVVGMDEHAFRSKYQWSAPNSKGPGKLNNPPQQGWTNTYPRSASIFEGKFKVYTPKEISQILPTQPLTNKPYFRIIIHNPAIPEQSDIRYLQADPQYKYANFQIASTLWGPLEGGMYYGNTLLESMLERPVQGEEASISAAPATIFRKYFMKPVYLLERLTSKINVVYGKYGPSLEASSYQADQNDVDKVGIGIHQNIVVSNGYGLGSSGPDGRPGKQDQQERLNIAIKNGHVDTSNTQIINQIFTAAYDFSKASNKTGKELQGIKTAAKMILTGMYKGVMGAPLITKNPVIFLTLLGGGAFLNKPSWISHAIKGEQNPQTGHALHIKQYGLQVTLLYRPDPRKQPTRGPIPDYHLLKDMFAMADYVNDTALSKDPQLDQLIHNYLQLAYSRSASPVSQAQAAHALNNVINQALPSYAPKIMLTSTWTQAGKPLQPPHGRGTTPPPGFEYIMDLDKGGQKTGELGWMPVGSDKALVNFDPHTSEYLFVAPGFPGKELPTGLYYWYRQGLDTKQVGKHKNVPVYDIAGNRYEYSGGKGGTYVKKGSQSSPSHTSGKSNEYDLYKKLDNGDDVIWKAVGSDAVLANLRQSTQPTGMANTFNYIYVAPGFLTLELPHGLYYWKSYWEKEGKPDIKRHQNVNVRNSPQGKNFSYGGKNNPHYINTKTKEKWDPTKHPKDPTWNG